MPKRNDIKSILIIGAGPIVIGQACEFDYSGSQACKVLREEGYKVILINSNPATIMTDPDFADATYIEPITPEMVTKIIIKEKPDVKSNNVHYLPFQAKIFVDEVINDWAKVKLSKFHFHDFGYIYKKDIQKINTIEKDWVKVAKKLINVPYLWGGRDSKGLDCSGLLQLALQAGGILFPRDTSKQIICKKLYLIHKKDISRGSLVFWDGHVGIMLDKKNILHANAFHMNVTVEPLNEACTRMKNELYYNLTKVK